jgi:ATP-dependent DNA helicase RecQ
MPMSDIDLLAALHQHFGYPAFRPGQAEALAHVMAGRNLLVVMPTGSGKSLIYQLAALCLPGTALIVSPLVALMKDQVDSLTRRKLPATFINSSLSLEEQNRRLRALQAGEYKLVLVAPERFRSVGFRTVISRIEISLLAVDEAHCLSQWGHDFRPDYLYLAEARRQLNPPVTVALTATATPRVQEDILHLLGLEQAAQVITGFNRPNLAFRVVPARRTADKLARLDELLADLPGAGLIYTGTRREAEEVAAHIRTKHRRPVEHYHAGLPDEARARVQDAFMAGDLPLVVATNAFGLGIDRPDVRFVIHYTLPGTLEAYYQEAGRAGRDGLPAEALLLFAPKDMALQKFFIDNASPTGEELRQVHEHLRRLPDATDLGALAEALDLDATKLRVALEQLETAQAVRRTDEAYGRMRLEAAPLTEAALRAVERTASERRRHKYDLLGRMVDYAQTRACRRRVLLKHFGDTSLGDVPPEACCDNCAQGAAPSASPQPAPALPPQAAVGGPAGANALAALSQAERAALIVLDALTKLGRPLGKTRLAQFLQGSESDAVAKYKDGPYFGRLRELRLSAIEALIEQLLDTQHLEQGGGLYPTLQLTPLGERALRQRAAIAVSLNRAPRLSPAASTAPTAEGPSNTLTATAELLARGLTPEQIAAERGLTEGTIYSHLATLIAAGQVDVQQVVPADTQARIIAAVEAVGSAAYLAPIKARLNDFTTYGEIRCVVEAWKRQQPAPPPPETA